MKKLLMLLVAFCIIIGASFSANAYEHERKNHFRIAGYFPGLFIGTKGLNTMMSLGLEGEYFVLQEVGVSFRIEEATDFKFGEPPHSLLSFVARGRYIFDVGESGKWALYAGGGIGGGIIGKSAGFGDIVLPSGGFWYEWEKNLFIGMDASFHIIIRDPTAVAFDITPSIRYQF